MSHQEFIPGGAEPTKELQSREPSIMEIVRDLAGRPGLEHVEAMERLIAMKERAEDREAKREFFEALALAQAEIPQISRQGMGQSNRFSRLEDIDAILRPIMAKHGFALSFDEKAAPSDQREHAATLSHRGGHSETKSITLPVDKGGNKTAVQAAGSSSTYAQRYLTNKHFNIVTREADTDGNDPAEINEEQVRTLETLIQDTKTNTKNFLDLIAGVPELKNIQQRDYKRVVNALETKKRQQETVKK